MEILEIRKNLIDVKEYVVINVLLIIIVFNIRYEFYLIIKYFEKIKKLIGKCLFIRGFS